MGLSVVASEAAGGLPAAIARSLDCRLCPVSEHVFPDGETVVRVAPGAVTDTAVIVAALERPNAGIIPQLFLAEALREYGAGRLLLVAPYLPYMRQDRRFHAGEGVSARYFARLLSGYYDGLVTVDPHLHRIPSLDAIYTIPSRAVAAAPSVAEWMKRNVERPLLIGPDSESAQWVEALSRRADCPYLVLEKKRYGDREVEVTLPEVGRWLQHTPVLFDDIIASGRTMIETLAQLRQAGLAAPVCIGVHGIFAGQADRDLLEAGAARVVTTNSVRHATNDIDLAAPLVAAVRELLEGA
jgi:ribose-phosphate pyrophosphokinase